MASLTSRKSCLVLFLWGLPPILSACISPWSLRTLLSMFFPLAHLFLTLWVSCNKNVCWYFLYSVPLLRSPYKIHSKYHRNRMALETRGSLPLKKITIKNLTGRIDQIECCAVQSVLRCTSLSAWSLAHFPGQQSSLVKSVNTQMETGYFHLKYQMEISWSLWQRLRFLERLEVRSCGEKRGERRTSSRIEGRGRGLKMGEFTLQFWN